MKAKDLKTINKASTFDVGNLGNWDTSKVTNMSQMFTNSGQFSATWSIGNLTNWDTSKVTDMYMMFAYAGQDATTWNDIGTLQIYVTNITAIFRYCKNAKATLNIYINPTNRGTEFENAAYVSGSGITVNYSSAVTSIDAIIASKSPNSNVVKGVQLD